MIEDKNKEFDDKIDLLTIAKTLWKAKALFGKVCSIAVFLGIVIAFSIPKTYKAEVVLAPESSSGLNIGGGISDIASMVGIDIGSVGTSVDAIYPELYPEIVQSTPFLTSLFQTQVSSKGPEFKNITLYTYLKDKQKETWWNRIIDAVIQLFKKKDRTSLKKKKLNNFMLNKEEYDIAQGIKNIINCNVDKKTSIITISITTQDPLISASLADTVKSKIQQYIIDYRTKKARNDLEYAQKLSIEAKAQYIKAQQKYTSYADANEDVVLMSFKAIQDELENEMQLRYNIYNQCAQQLQLAKAKVQERTPAFTVIQPATVPLKKDGPKRVTILFVFVFMAIVFTSIYVLYKDASKKQ